MKSSPTIPDRDRFAIARYDRDDLILNGDWLVSANNLNLAFLNLSRLVSFLIHLGFFGLFSLLSPLSFDLLCLFNLYI